MAKFTPEGRIIPDQEPIARPQNIRPPTQEEMIAKAVSEEFSRRAEQTGEFETFEEANDFGDLDEDEMLSPYEVHDMPEEFLDERRFENEQETQSPPATQAAEPAERGIQPANQASAESPTTPDPDPDTQEFERIEIPGIGILYKQK